MALLCRLRGRRESLSLSQLRVKEADDKRAPDARSRQRPRFLRARLPGRLAPRVDDENGGRQELRWWEWLGLDVRPTANGGPSDVGSSQATPTADRKTEGGESVLARAVGRIGDALVLGPR